MKCSVCGSESNADARFCSNCGTMLNPAADTLFKTPAGAHPGAAASPPSPESPTGTPLTSPWTNPVGLLVVLAAVAVLGYFAYRVLTPGDAATESAPQAPPSTQATPPGTAASPPASEPAREPALVPSREPVTGPTAEPPAAAPKAPAAPRPRAPSRKPTPQRPGGIRGDTRGCGAGTRADAPRATCRTAEAEPDHAVERCARPLRRPGPDLPRRVRAARAVAALRRLLGSGPAVPRRQVEFPDQLTRAFRARSASSRWRSVTSIGTNTSG